MYICQHCGFKYMLPVYEAERHIFLRCPNKDCGKMDTKMKQLEIRGKVVKHDGVEVNVNTYDGVIDVPPTKYDLLRMAGFGEEFIKEMRTSDEAIENGLKNNE